MAESQILPALSSLNMSFLEGFISIFFIIVFFVMTLRLYIKISQNFARVEGCTMEGKTVIVTGGSNGIGEATSKLLAGMGARVIIACRNVQKGARVRDAIVAATGNQNICVMRLDLSSLSSIRSFVSEVEKGERKLDVLINNAGILGPAKKIITEDGLEMTYATNHFGPFLLTNLLLGLLKRSAPSRIVNVSSVVYGMGKIDVTNMCAEKGYSSFTMYNDTKLANILFTRELSKRLDTTGVTVNCLHPGTVKTSLLNYRLPLRIVSFLIGSLFWKDPEVGAQTSVHLAASDEVHGVTGQYFDNCQAKVPTARARDDEMARTLWEVSERLTGLQR